MMLFMLFCDIFMFLGEIWWHRTISVSGTGLLVFVAPDCIIDLATKQLISIDFLITFKHLSNFSKPVFKTILSRLIMYILLDIQIVVCLFTNHGPSGGHLHL